MARTSPKGKLPRRTDTAGTSDKLRVPATTEHFVPGPGPPEEEDRRPRWDPSAITGVSSRPPRDAVTPSHAPPRGTSPRCYARCSEASSSDPGIRLRPAYSAGRPAPRCCKGLPPGHRLKERKRMAMPVLLIAEANLTPRRLRGIAGQMTPFIRAAKGFICKRRPGQATGRPGCSLSGVATSLHSRARGQRRRPAAKCAESPL